MCWTPHYSGWEGHRKTRLLGPLRPPVDSPAPQDGLGARFMRSPRPPRGRPTLRGWSGCTAALGQEHCFSAVAISLRSPTGKGGKLGGGSVMELRTKSPRKYVQTRLVNHCAQCGETIFLPEWSEYMDRQRVRHLWECEACGYKFETLVSFPDP